jgi:flagella basal body P-ring formation protein FlgA
MRRSALVLVVLALAAAARATAQTADSPVVVTLRPTVVVDEPVVTVGAMAAVEGGPAWLRQKIAALDVADVPAVGRTVAVSRNQLALRLRLAGIDADCFRVEGPAQARVQLAAGELTEVEVLKTAEKAVLQRLQANPGDVELRLVEELRLPTVRVNTGDVVRLRGDCPLGSVAVGKTRVNVTVLVNGMQRGVVSVALELCLYRHVAVAARPIAAGQAVQSEDLRSERRLVTPGDRSVAYSDQLLGHHVMRAVVAGQVLTTTDLDLPLQEDQVAIKARDRVRLVATVGGMNVQAMGEALEDGRLGQMVRVRNVDSNKVVSGRVVGRSTVEVDY